MLRTGPTWILMPPLNILHLIILLFKEKIRRCCLSNSNTTLLARNILILGILRCWEYMNLRRMKSHDSVVCVRHTTHSQWAPSPQPPHTAQVSSPSAATPTPGCGHVLAEREAEKVGISACTVETKRFCFFPSMGNSPNTTTEFRCWAAKIK